VYRSTRMDLSIAGDGLIVKRIIAVLMPMDAASSLDLNMDGKGKARYFLRPRVIAAVVVYGNNQMTSSGQ
jgi:hypothetical protein